MERLFIIVYGKVDLIDLNGNLNTDSQQKMPSLMSS